MKQVAGGTVADMEAAMEGEGWVGWVWWKPVGRSFYTILNPLNTLHSLSLNILPLTIFDHTLTIPSQLLNSLSSGLAVAGGVIVGEMIADSFMGKRWILWPLFSTQLMTHQLTAHSLIHYTALFIHTNSNTSDDISNHPTFRRRWGWWRWWRWWRWWGWWWWLVMYSFSEWRGW